MSRFLVWNKAQMRQPREKPKGMYAVIYFKFGMDHIHKMRQKCQNVEIWIINGDKNVKIFGME